MNFEMYFICCSLFEMLQVLKLHVASGCSIGWHGSNQLPVIFQLYHQLTVFLSIPSLIMVLADFTSHESLWFISSSQ